MAPLIVAEIVIEKDMKRKRMASKDEMDLEVEERITIDFGRSQEPVSESVFGPAT